MKRDFLAFGIVLGFDGEFPGLDDHNLVLGLVSREFRYVLDSIDNIHSFEDGTENDMTPVQPRSFDGANEELRSVGVFSGIGHRESSRSGVTELEVLIGEFVAVDTFPACSISLGEITTLDHETLDYPVESGSFVTKTVLTSCESPEVLDSFRHSFTVQAHHDTTQRFPSMFDIEVDLVGDDGSFDCQRSLFTSEQVEREGSEERQE